MDHPESGPAEFIERDDLTEDMFGGASELVAEAMTPSASSAAYTVLARKYRPRTFEDLIGQEAMVRTLTHAFAANRIAHAFMLTGVRGVGKTTTARLLARALNYETDSQKSPSIALSLAGFHCQAIIDGRHIDVLELDAASHTSVDGMRDLLESARYAPVEARYKVYVIDEVHMLSSSAFNALLKTLEEPPPHMKFILATTEIRKVPVTILSRCQRFDLRRVEPPVLIPHLEKVCAAEGVAIDSEALALIARAAEGSVRDSLSLLDQALVQGEAGEAIGGESVRDMLGLADRTATLILFEHIVSGRLTEALLAYRTLYGYGADPSQIMNDLMEYTHAASVAKAINAEATRLPRDQAQRLSDLAARIPAGTLNRLWTVMLKAFEEIRRSPDANAACEMTLIRLCYVSELPGPEALMKRLQAGEPLLGGPVGGVPSGRSGGGTSGGGVTAQGVAMHAQPQTGPALNSFQDVLALIEAKRDIGLRVDVERFVKLVSFRPGAITFEPAPKAPIDLVRRLASKLKEWTGERWLIATEGSGGAETIRERDQRELSETKSRIQADPFVLSVLSTFPGAEITQISRAPRPIMPAPQDPNELEKEDD